MALKLNRSFSLIGLLSLLCSMLLISACGGSNKEQEGDGFSRSEEAKEETEKDTARKRNRKQVFYGVPTPHQMLTLLESYDHEPAEDKLLAPSKAQEAVNPDHRALLLGIYSTDLAYSSVFGLGSKSLEYFKTVRQLGDRIEVTSAFDQETIEKIEKSVGSSDSLKNISKDTYMEAFRYLEKNDRGKTLALMVAGGWTEALYLSVMMVDGYKKDDPTIQYIAQERGSFKNVRSFMKKYEEHENVADMLQRMEGLKKAYDALGKKGGASKMEQKDDRMVLSGGSSVTIGEKGFQRIRQEVKALRQEMVEWNNSGSS